MGGFVKPLLVLLSVVLNGAFVTAWLSHTLPARMCANNDKVTDCPLLDKIGVSETQREELSDRLTRFRESARTQCKEIGRLRGELITLLAAPEPCIVCIRAKQQEILEGQRKMQELVVDQILAEKATLSPKQQKQLFALIRTQCNCSSSDETSDGHIDGH